MTIDLRVAIKGFAQRLKDNKGKQVNNSDLRAGSPMYYYCKHCGIHTETLPETHWSTPTTVCGGCKVLVEQGIIEVAKKYATTTSKRAAEKIIDEVLK